MLLLRYKLVFKKCLVTGSAVLFVVEKCAKNMTPTPALSVLGVYVILLLFMLKYEFRE